MFASLADPTRRRMVRQLGLRDSTAGELRDGSGMSLVAVLKHLAVLEQAGIVETEKVGRARVCRLRSERLRLAEDWIDEARLFWSASLANMRAMLEAEADPKKDP
ncbi:MAG: winged helix-turn-helix transcriptional regulator [Fimbriimonadaceae bacterium]|nr:MAG: winged helix-turn-helix transcriptional regulator [Fimbriimonadaceae bacterium]